MPLLRLSKTSFYYFIVAFYLITNTNFFLLWSIEKLLAIHLKNSYADRHPRHGYQVTLNPLLASAQATSFVDDHRPVAPLSAKKC